MTFADIKTNLDDFFDEDEVVFYNNVNDLSKKLNFYKENESLRKKIAKKGWVKYHKHFNSQIVSDYIINKIFNISNKNSTLWEK